MSTISQPSLFTNDTVVASRAVRAVDTPTEPGADSDENWYEVVEGDSLEQGDILFELTAPRALINPEGQPEIRIGIGNYVVLSQTCDLENDKVREVLLANIDSYQNLAHDNEAARSTKFRQALIQSSDIAYFLLHEFAGKPALEWSVVNFHQLRLADVSYCRTQARNLGPRLRMISPYKENLAQCFGRYIMRVALPSTAHGFKDVKYVQPPTSSGAGDSGT